MRTAEKRLYCIPVRRREPSKSFLCNCVTITATAVLTNHFQPGIIKLATDVPRRVLWTDVVRDVIIPAFPPLAGCDLVAVLTAQNSLIPQRRAQEAELAARDDLSSGGEAIMPKVTLYTSPTCSWCRRARQYLDEKGIPYRYIDVTEDRYGTERLLQVSGQAGLPVITVDNEVIIGFDRNRLDELFPI